MRERSEEKEMMRTDRVLWDTDVIFRVWLATVQAVKEGKG